MFEAAFQFQAPVAGQNDPVDVAGIDLRHNRRHALRAGRDINFCHKPDIRLVSNLRKQPVQVKPVRKQVFLLANKDADAQPRFVHNARRHSGRASIAEIIQ